MRKLVFQGVLSLCFAMAFLASTYAQTIPVEAMLGNQNYFYQHTFARPWAAQSRWGLFHTASLYAFHYQEGRNEIMNQSYLTYGISPFAKVALGSFYASAPGFSPSASVQLFFRRKHFSFALSPRADIRIKGSFDAMLLVDYRPPINERFWMVYRFQTMSNWGGKGHNRSYQNFRLGIGHRQAQAGLAFNMDEYGPDINTYYNLGVFIRYDFE